MKALIIKVMISIVLLTQFIYADNNQQLEKNDFIKQLGKTKTLSQKDIENFKEKYSYLLTKKENNINPINNLTMEKNINYDLLLNLWKKEFGDDKFIVKQFYKFKENFEKPEMQTTIFYFFTMDMKPDIWKAFFYDVEKLTDVKYYGILAGYNKEVNRIIHDVYDKSNKDINLRIKPHPILMSKLGITKVPAYVLAECPRKGRFQYLACDYKYIARGDISLEDFLHILSEKHPEYRKYYFEEISTTDAEVQEKIENERRQEEERKKEELEEEGINLPKISVKPLASAMGI